jgi:malate dehydrogenase (oxaloacetate-decarboxylating)(NADP+)
MSMRTLLSAEVVRRFGVIPKVALLSHSNFGESERPSAQKMRDALNRLRDVEPTLEIEGEMQGDAAFSEIIRQRIIPDSRFAGQANLLVMPTLDAAHISYNLLKSVTNAVNIGPILLGAANSAHIIGPSASVRRILNMSALCVAEAQTKSA